MISGLIFLAVIAKADTWDHHKSNLQKYSTEIEIGEKELKDLITQKKHGAHSPELLKEIDEKHRQVEKSLEAYNKEVEHVKYRHPGRELEEQARSYSISTPRADDDLESDIGVDGKLDKVKQKMKRQYGNYSTEHKVEPSENNEGAPKKDEPQRILIKK